MRAPAQQELESFCLRSLLANPADRMSFKDCQGRYLMLSAGWLAALADGSFPGSLIGKTDFDVFSKEHAQAAFDDEQRILETGKPLVAKIERETFSDRPDAWVSTTKLPVRDGDGTIIGTWAQSRDFTADLDAAQALSDSREELRASEQEHRALFERNPQPMLAFERATFKIVAASSAMVDRYGYSRDELLSMTLFDLLPVEDVPLLKAYFVSPERKPPGFATSGQWRHRYKDGTTIDVEITRDDLILDGRECRLLMCLDVTERNRSSVALAIARDAAVAASNLKSAFVANMSHEIRTPMNGVIGMSEMLLETELTPEQRGYAEQVCRSGERMLTIISDILDISKIETGKLQLDLTEFDLRETVEGVRADMALQANAKGIGLGVAVDPATPERVVGDRGRLHQILLNLVSNAVKFTAEGNVGIDVNVVARDGPDPVVRLAVTDSGIGIDPDTMTHVFDPFTQADISTTREYGGTGLGLTIVRELVELMGGEIGAESVPGAGSTFWVQIPLPAVAASECQPNGNTNSAPAAERFWLDPPLVLVAEDNLVNQIVAVRALERCGCRTEVVCDGRRALKALAAGQYDAVLMDCQMPDMDGFEATVELRRRENGGRRTPVIAMTANAMSSDRDRCLAAGMDAHISKPMRRQELIDALHEWIPRSVAAPAG